MRVQTAHPDDIPSWLTLAAQVEPLFGPMVGDPAFHAALRKNIDRGTAYCVRAEDGAPGAPLMGGLLFSPHPPRYEIGWLAVADGWRRRGVGTKLVEHVFTLVRPPAEVALVTFAQSIPDGLPARRFYERLGFLPGESGPINAAGFPTQVYRRLFVHPPTVRAVIQDGERYLLVQHEPAYPPGDGLWALPGGRVNADDPDYEATLRREMREEFRIDVDIVRLIGTYTLREHQHHVFHARPLSTDLTLEPSEVSAAGWFTLDEVRACHAAGKLFAAFMLDAILASQDHAVEP